MELHIGCCNKYFAVDCSELIANPLGLVSVGFGTNTVVDIGYTVDSTPDYSHYTVAVVGRNSCS